jgi:hypothetical protein
VQQPRTEVSFELGDMLAGHRSGHGEAVSGALNPRKSGVGKQSVAVIRGSQLTALNFL